MAYSGSCRTVEVQGLFSVFISQILKSTCYLVLCETRYCHHIASLAFLYLKAAPACNPTAASSSAVDIDIQYLCYKYREQALNLDSSTRATVRPGVYHRVKAELARTIFGKWAARGIEGGGLKRPPLSCVRVPGLFFK